MLQQVCGSFEPHIAYYGCRCIGGYAANEAVQIAHSHTHHRSHHFGREIGIADVVCNNSCHFSKLLFFFFVHNHAIDKLKGAYRVVIVIEKYFGTSKHAGDHRVEVVFVVWFEYEYVGSGIDTLSAHIFAVY